MHTHTTMLALILLFTACKEDATTTMIVDERIIPQLITQMKPVDDGSASYNVSQNVIQGMAAFENGWFTTQTSSTEGGTLLINYLDATGTSLFHQRISIESHGQDLSIDVVSNNELHLYTSIGDFDDNRNTGVLRLKVLLNTDRDWSQTTIDIDAIYELNYSNATPTLNSAKDRFAIRSKKSVLVHLKDSLLANNFTPLYHFDLNAGQLTDNEQRSMWFQGIAMQDNMVYCLTGNSIQTTYKKIYFYNDKGIVTKKYFFDQNDFDIDIDIKFEPESLYLDGDELYFLIMTKNSEIEGNIKYLYKIGI